jgi:uncharacterized damage-inducible protein DinB
MADIQPNFTPEFVLTFRDMMLQGMQTETQTTKKVLAAVPDSGHDYRPDPKARSAKELAWHLAAEDVKFLDGIANLAFNTKAGPAPATTAEIVTWYDANIPRAMARVQAMTAEQLLTPVDFFGMFNFPAAMYLNFLYGHSVHHRGELAVYLRPMGSKVPSIYGPSADTEVQAA